MRQLLGDYSVGDDLGGGPMNGVQFTSEMR